MWPAFLSIVSFSPLKRSGARASSSSPSRRFSVPATSRQRRPSSRRCGAPVNVRGCRVSRPWRSARRFSPATWRTPPSRTATLSWPIQRSIHQQPARVHPDVLIVGDHLDACVDAEACRGRWRTRQDPAGGDGRLFRSSRREIAVEIHVDGARNVACLVLSASPMRDHPA